MDFSGGVLLPDKRDNHIFQLRDGEFVHPTHALCHSARRISSCSWPRPHPARRFRFWWDATAPRAADAIGRAAQTPASHRFDFRSGSCREFYRGRALIPTKLLAPLQGAKLLFGHYPRVVAALQPWANFRSAFSAFELAFAYFPPSPVAARQARDLRFEFVLIREIRVKRPCTLASWR